MKARILNSLAMGVAVLIGVVSIPALAQEPDPLGYTLLIQQSPPGAGTVSPGDGVHKFGIGEVVTLSAVPVEGYRFLYWLGDVSTATTPTTSVNLDSPKMVIAVFERANFEEEDQSLPAVGGAGRGAGSFSGLIASPYPVFAPGSVNAASGGGEQTIIVNNPIIDFPDIPSQDDDDILVPGDPIPEPATVLLLAVGTAALSRKRK
ncbi:MAG: PEP-CTERM sorting domain-containing protein [Planctomycetes bacterium]|nr:PEP-CTERM sorting domain-containing protein [Planctomycetota bacterium]